jgi:Flp pilus assembly protein TadD
MRPARLAGGHRPGTQTRRDVNRLDCLVRFASYRSVDQLSAHLDRGWDLAQRGDATGAAACGRRALELDPRSPEVHNLLGYAAALQGESDEALDHYRQAIALDETYFEAMLNAAELLIPLGDWDEAMQFCDDALDLAESDEERCDCLLLKVDAHLSKGDEDSARQVLQRVPSGPYTNPVHSFLVGRALYELGDLANARPHMLDASTRDPENPDAHYYTGLLLDDDGHAALATLSFLQTRELDALRPPPAWAPSRTDFEASLRSALEQIPGHLRSKLEGSPIYCVDAPGAEVVVDGVDPRQGILVETQELRCRIFAYQRNLERLAGNRDDLGAELVRALERELSAAFAAPEIPSTELN